MTKRTTPEAAIDAGFVLMRLVDERARIDQQIQDQVRAVISAGGSWTTVGVALGMTKQGAQQRYGQLVAAGGTDPQPSAAARAVTSRPR